ncbi:MAG TPA: hypothetical protein VMS86_12975 [Thermoanaerobaculia bacterium]|nr:hypothetical protein [Thermoanaerobaculia bacterium]
MRRLSCAAITALLCVHSMAARGEPTRVIDLLAFGTPADELTRLYGSAGDGSRGVPVAGGWDVDGDGLPDSAFSAVTASPLGRNKAGEMIVVFGSGMLGGFVTTAHFDPGLLTIAGQHACEIAGVEIEIADVTGDGIGDLLIGRQNHSPTWEDRPGAGALTILLGGQALRDHAETLAHLDLDCVRPDAPEECEPLVAGMTAITFVGAASYDRLGIWMRAGDVDGDGIDDIVVGADQVDKVVGGELETNRGAAYVIRGGAHLAAMKTIDLAAFGTMSFDADLDGHVALLEPPAGSGAIGAKPGYHLGATVHIGDLDGNGRGEVLAAASLNRSNASLGLGDDCASGGTAESNGGPDHGEVFIAWDDHFPMMPWASGYTIDLTCPSPNLTCLRGSPVAPTNGELGEEMLAGLDYDGDGTPDLFLGDLTGNPDPGGPGDRPLAGLGHVFFNAAALKGVDARLDELLAAPPAGLRHTLIVGPSVIAIGADTATHGDYDGDGIADLAVCNPKDDPQGRDSAGTVHVLYGEIGGWPAVIDLAPANLPSPEAVRIVEIQGAFGGNGGDGGDTLCYSAAGGHVDLDGVPDLLINEMEGNGFMPDPENPGQLLPAADVGNLLLISGAALLERPLLDIDGDGEAVAETDGRLFIRYLFGFTGNALLEGAVGAGATRSGPEIELYLARLGAAFDVDGDDQLGALGDGLVVLRYLLKFSGSMLVEGALGANATRTDPVEVEAFLDRLKPPP